MLAPTPTSNFADVQNVSNDVLRDLGWRFPPGHVDGVGGQSASCQTFWSSREIFGLGYSQPCAGLVGTGTVFRNALVDGLVLRGNPSQSQSAAENNDRSSISAGFSRDPKPSAIQTFNPKNIQEVRLSKETGTCHPPVVVGQLDVVSWHEHLAVLQPDEVRLRNPLGHTGKHSTAPCWFGYRLWPLQKLWRS